MDLDLTSASEVELVISDDGTKLWINVNGACVDRIYRIEKLELKCSQKVLRKIRST